MERKITAARAIGAYKRCTKCGEMKPATTKAFCRHATGRGGLEAQCKSCRAASAKAWAQANPGRCRASNKAWEHANHERSNAQRRVRRKAHSERVRAQARAWYKAHPERVRAHAKAWRRANPEHRKAIDRRHIALKRNASINDFTAAQWQAMLEYYNYSCAYCLQLFDNLEQEHVIPLSRGGDNTRDNIVPACRSCNARKNNKTLLEFVVAESGLVFR